MWIERLDIDGFGRLAGPFVFGPGLTLVTGPNEAGKTTLQEALVRAMFGFTSKERRRYGGTAVKDDFDPWVHPCCSSASCSRYWRRPSPTHRNELIRETGLAWPGAERSTHEHGLQA